jgi:hypothetical protein
MVMTKDVLFSLTKGGYAPQEEMLEVARKKGKLYIGIPKEMAFQENRVPLVPDAVALLVNNGHKIVVEDEAWVATDVYIAPNVTIGRGAVIGARSSVFKDMPEGYICLGSPCKPIKPREMQ